MSCTNIKGAGHCSENTEVSACPMRSRGISTSSAATTPRCRRGRNSVSGAPAPPVADRYADALFAFLTTDRSAVSVGLEHYVSESTLYRLRKAFYEQYACGAAEQQERKEG